MKWGAGRSDIAVEDEKRRQVIIIETKRFTDYDDLERDSEEALRQIAEKE